MAGSTPGRWEQRAIVGGAVLLGACTISTLVLSARIDARANRIVQINEDAAKAGVETVARLEAKLDGGIGVVQRNGEKIDYLAGRVEELTAALATTTTTTTATTTPQRKPPASPPTTRTSTTYPPYTPPFTLPPYTPPAPPPTTPCRFLIILSC